jgi:hypothetical protein
MKTLHMSRVATGACFRTDYTMVKGFEFQSTEHNPMGTCRHAIVHAKRQTVCHQHYAYDMMFEQAACSKEIINSVSSC